LMESDISTSGSVEVDTTFKLALILFLHNSYFLTITIIASFSRFVKCYFVAIISHFHMSVEAHTSSLTLTVEGIDKMFKV
jgi:hypothetical protein